MTNTPITPRDLIDLACFYSMTNTSASITFALRAIVECREGVDDPTIVSAANALIQVLDPSAKRIAPMWTRERGVSDD